MIDARNSGSDKFDSYESEEIRHPRGRSKNKRHYAPQKKTRERTEWSSAELLKRLYQVLSSM